MSEISTERAARLLLAGFLGLVVWATWSGPFVLDEWEHLHAAWKLSRGEALYVDFFEHHHPPIYLLLAPLVAWWPESVSVILAARALQLLIALGCVALVYRIGVEIEGPAVGRWAAAMWLGFVPVLVTVGKVRPDTPMLLLLLAAVLCGLRAVGSGEAAGGMPDERDTRTAPGARRHPRARHWALAGASWSAALLLSSKAVLFLPVLALFPFIAFLDIRGGGSRGGDPRAGWLGALAGTLPACLRMTAGAAGPLLVGVAYLVATDSLGAFWDWCVRFNLSFVTLRMPEPSGMQSMLTVHAPPAEVALALGNTGALLLALVGGLHVCRHGGRRRRTLLPGGAVLTLLVLWLAGRGLYWDLLPALVFPAILAGRGAVVVLLRVASWSAARTAGLTVGVLGAGVCLLLWAQPAAWVLGGSDASREPDRSRFEHVREHTAPGEPVHQEWPMFNLHRPDVSYFWFGGPAFVRRAARLGLAEPYDLRGLVSRERPAYVSVLRRSEHHAWLVGEAGYRWIEELQLYERVRARASRGAAPRGIAAPGVEHPARGRHGSPAKSVSTGVPDVNSIPTRAPARLCVE